MNLNAFVQLPDELKAMISLGAIAWGGFMYWVLWRGFKDEEAPPEPNWWVKYLIPGVGAVLLARLGWDIAPDWKGALLAILYFGGLGLGFGYYISLIVHLPRTALSGAAVGFVISDLTVFALIMIGMINGLDVWSRDCQITYLAISLTTVLMSAAEACRIKRSRPSEGPKDADSSMQLRSSG